MGSGGSKQLAKDGGGSYLGKYHVWVKWGGAAGKWQDRGEAVTVTALEPYPVIHFNGSNQFATYDAETKTASWEFGKGNCRGKITFSSTGAEGKYFWPEGKQEGCTFSGMIQEPNGDGAIDFRGALCEPAGGGDDGEAKEGSYVPGWKQTEEYTESKLSVTEEVEKQIDALSGKAGAIALFNRLKGELDGGHSMGIDREVVIRAAVHKRAQLGREEWTPEVAAAFGAFLGATKPDNGR